MTNELTNKQARFISEVGFSEKTKRAQSAKEQAPQNPLEFTRRFLEHVEKTHITRSRENPKVLKRIKSYYHKEFVLKPEDFPKEDYLKSRMIQAQERGIPYIVPSEEDIEKIKTETIENQKNSLNSWIEYLSSKDSDAFPIWAKYWAFNGVTKLSSTLNYDYEADEYSFAKRERSTLADFPELNPEILAKCMEHIMSKIDGDPKNPQNLKLAIQSTNFGKVYSHYLSEYKREERERDFSTTEGEWVKFKQGNPNDLDALVDSLKGRFTGWCTSGRHTAERQLEGGDFYVFYSLDKDKKPKIPRIAIRMEGKSIGEIRGVASGQNFDEAIAGTDLIENKLGEIVSPEGAKDYLKRSADMKMLTSIHKKIQKNPEYELSPEEEAFIMQTNSKIEGFGQRQDKRVNAIKIYTELRNTLGIKKIDAESIKLIVGNGQEKVLFEIFEFIDKKNRQELLSILSTEGRYQLIAENINRFSSLPNDLAYSLIENNFSEAVARHINKFVGIDYEDIANILISRGNGANLCKHLGNFEGLNQGEIITKLLTENKESESRTARNITGFTKYFENFDNENFRNLTLDQIRLIASNIDLGIERGDSNFDVNFIFQNIDLLPEMDESVAHEIMKRYVSNSSEVVEKIIQNREKFKGLKLDKDFILKSIDQTRSLSVIIKYINLFDESAFDAEVAEKILVESYLSSGERGDVKFIIHNKEKFKGLKLDNELAKKLIAKAKGDIISSNFESFGDLDISPEEALVIVKTSLGVNITDNDNLLRFLKKYLTDDEIVSQLINRTDAKNHILKNLHKFPNTTIKPEGLTS